MKTISFIGSDKNAGKTTAFNHVYAQMSQLSSPDEPICLTSIGINGEEIDYFTGLEKPTVKLHKDSYFITAREHLEDIKGQYRKQHAYVGAEFSKEYILGRCREDLHLVLEGPNSKHEIRLIKQQLEPLLTDGHLLIDGSIDRCFLACPTISDAFYFALYLSSHPDQLIKAQDLLLPLGLPSCTTELAALINQYTTPDTKALFFDQKNGFLYRGTDIPFLDEELKTLCTQRAHEPGALYLNGALSRSLYRHLAPFRSLSLVLDNFFLYQNVFPDQDENACFMPKLYLYHRPHILGIFIRRESDPETLLDDMLANLPLPQDVPVQDLVREI